MNRCGLTRPSLRSQTMRYLYFVLMTLVACDQLVAIAYEDAQVLPEGVRRVQIRSINAELHHRRDQNGRSEHLSTPLARDLNFDQVVQKASAVERGPLEGLMLSEGIDQNDSAGSFRASVKGQVQA